MMVGSMTKKMAADYLRLVMKNGRYMIVDDPDAVLKTALEKDVAKEKRAATNKKKEKGPIDKTRKSENDLSEPMGEIANSPEE